MRRGLLLAMLVLGAAAGRARAYPQFQLSTGAARCNQCHYAPAGGGLITNYGREEAGDTISMGGDGAFLHGLWKPPKWLQLGADVRLAGVLVNEGATGGSEIEAFPMQGDVYVRPEIGSFSLYLTAGFRGSARGSAPTFVSRLISREHYLMWRPKPIGVYLRAGRFFAPYGLRLAEHPSYVRRWLGFDTLEETYNLSGGYVTDDWELHVTAFHHDFWRPVGLQATGAAVLYERRFDTKASIGGQARLAVNHDDTRAQAGVTGKYYLGGPKLLFMGELNLVRESFDLDLFDAPSRWQLAAYLGATWTFMRGFQLTGVLERWDEDLSVKGVARSAIGGRFQWYPYAHFEVSLYSRLQLIGSGKDDGDPSEVILLQVHYYL